MACNLSWINQFRTRKSHVCYTLIFASRRKHSSSCVWPLILYLQKTVEPSRAREHFHHHHGRMLTLNHVEMCIKFYISTVQVVPCALLICTSFGYIVLLPRCESFPFDRMAIIEKSILGLHSGFSAWPVLISSYHNIVLNIFCLFGQRKSMHASNRLFLLLVGRLWILQNLGFLIHFYDLYLKLWYQQFSCYADL